MRPKYPLAELIETRLRELSLDPRSLGIRLGYANPAKAAGRVHALAFGHFSSSKSGLALSRLPAALELPDEVVDQAVLDTRLAIAEENRAICEKQRLERAAREADWRKNFHPHGVILTERRTPDQLVFCAVAGGPRVRLMIPFNLSLPATTFVAQAVEGLKNKASSAADGRKVVTFFGPPIGLAINYSPDLSLRCDLNGDPIEWLAQAYRIGAVEFVIGGRAYSSETVAPFQVRADASMRGPAQAG